MAFRRNLRRLDFWRCNVRVIASVAFLSVAIMTSQSRTVSATDKLDFQFFDVSLPALSLGPEERVSAFNCEVRGAIVRVNSPLLWNLSLDGATGGRSYLKANAVDRCCLSLRTVSEILRQVYDRWKRKLLGLRCHSDTYDRRH
jgi:hypothetical protein